MPSALFWVGYVVHNDDVKVNIQTAARGLNHQLTIEYYLAPRSLPR
jgi:hypothetical protein